jgi:hypothetical protein
MSAKTAVKGHTAKHVTARKHVATGKHSPAKTKKPATAKGAKAKVTTKAKASTHAKAAGFAVGDLLPVCSFEAVAQSLRLAGQFVDDDEVAWLWELAGSPPLGASLGAALDMAGEHGLAGFRPQRVKVEGLAPVCVQDHPTLPLAQDETVPLGPLGDLFACDVHGLILHVDVPGPHAVLSTADGWWSWGELLSPWRCHVSEAWAVSWT